MKREKNTNLEEKENRTKIIKISFNENNVITGN